MQGLIATTGEQQRSRAKLARRLGLLRDGAERDVDDALAQERRRIAADVHDLIMQDLALALATARTLVDEPARAARASVVVSAGERALAGARQILDGLSEREPEPVIDAVGASVRAAARHVPLSFDADGVPAHRQPDPPTLDALVHIGREAVTNAVRHGRASALEVALEHAEEWRLLVRDDGRGFDTADAGRGFGLESMRGHAHALGGSLRITSVPGVGTTVEAALP